MASAQVHGHFPDQSVASSEIVASSRTRRVARAKKSRRQSVSVSEKLAQGGRFLSEAISRILATQSTVGPAMVFA